MLLLTFRFFVQLADADTQNPYVQIIYRVTQGLNGIIKRFPVLGEGRLSIGLLVLIVLVRLIDWAGNSLLSGQGPSTSVDLALVTFYSLLLDFVRVVNWLVIGSFIASWIVLLFQNTSPLVMLFYQLPEPLYASFRRFLPQTGMFDIAPLIVLLVLIVTGVLLRHAAVASGVGPFLGLSMM